MVVQTGRHLEDSTYHTGTSLPTFTHKLKMEKVHHKLQPFRDHLGIYWAHCGIFENGVLLMYTLEGVSSVANFITAYEESQ